VGAGELIVTVPVGSVRPTTEVGLKVTDATWIGMSETVSDMDAPLYGAVILTVDAVRTVFAL